MIILVFLSLLTNAANLDGNWQMACKGTADEDFYRPQLKIEGDNWTEEIPFFEEAGCKTEYLSFTLSWKATGQKQNLDLYHQAFLVTPKTNETAEGLNMIKYCGLTKWQAGKSQNISGRYCGDVGAAYPVGTKIYSIMKWENEKLWLGVSSKTADGKTPSTRHVTFENEPYLKTVH